jgi:hypothetical protein
MKKFILFFFCCFNFIFFIASCDAKSQYTKAELIPIDTLKIDFNIDYIFYDEQTKQNYFIEKHKGEIYIDSLTFYNENLIKLFSIKIGEKYQTTIFTIKSLDSIFSISVHTPTLNYFNRNGLVYSWNLDYIFRDRDCPLFFMTPPVIIDSIFYFLAEPFPRSIYMNFNDLRDLYKIEYFFRNQRAMAKFQIQGTKISNPQRFLNYPIEYYKDSSFYTHYNFNNLSSNIRNELIVDFRNSDSIVVIKNDTIKKYLAKSKYITVPNMHKIGEAFPIPNDINYEGRYDGVKYDRYRNLHYRIVTHPSTANENSNTVTQWYEKPWSFIILDENFNYIDEIVFSGKEQIGGNIKIMPQGLLLTKYIKNGLCEEDTKKYILHKIVLK